VKVKYDKSLPISAGSLFSAATQSDARIPLNSKLLALMQSNQKQTLVPSHKYNLPHNMRNKADRVPDALRSFSKKGMALNYPKMRIRRVRYLKNNSSAATLVTPEDYTCENQDEKHTAASHMDQALSSGGITKTLSHVQLNSG